jgi:hypothetical protein
MPTRAGVVYRSGATGRLYAGEPRGWWRRMSVYVVLVGDQLHGIQYGWGGMPTAWAARDVPGQSGRQLLASVTELAMGLLKKGDVRRVGGVNGSLIEPDDLSAKYPVLWSHLTQTSWDDGLVRETSSLLVFLQDGMLKGMVRDREHGLCLWMAAGSLGGLLDALEAGLCDPQAEWRIDRQKEGQQAKRVRKTSGGG